MNKKDDKYFQSEYHIIYHSYNIFNVQFLKIHMKMKDVSK